MKLDEAFSSENKILRNGGCDESWSTDKLRWGKAGSLEIKLFLSSSA